MEQQAVSKKAQRLAGGYSVYRGFHKLCDAIVWFMYKNGDYDYGDRELPEAIQYALDRIEAPIGEQLSIPA